MNSEQRKKLFRFLKEIGAYNAYCIYLKHRIENTGISLYKKFNKLPSHEPIIYSFNWNQTKQGYNFWSFLNTFYSLKIAKINIMDIPSIKQLIDRDYLNKLCKQ